ncbi:hypothetical protein ACFRQM_47825 [Streptomyces sp. NPDC056831]|uniref:hypothetical protein n=1 Tax=Streptomyces sp. NPDC056831 TaxID=3345954 RepID=UPI0036925598
MPEPGFGSVEQSFADTASMLAYGAAFDRARAAGTTLVASSGDMGPMLRCADR